MDSLQMWTWFMVGGSFALYIGIAIWSRAKSTGDFYVASKSVHPVANGMATGADWMSAASFISMAGIIAFSGRDGARYLMGWTGGYVLLAMLLAPYLRKFGKFTVPDFVGERYYSNTARIVAALCGIFISFTYIGGQMQGVGIAFSRFFEVSFNQGIYIGMGIVFFYAVLGGMKGITYTQVAQYCVLILAYLIPAIFLAILITGNPIPQIALGSEAKEGGYILDKLDGLYTQLGFDRVFTGPGSKTPLDIFMITFALMVGTAGLPHVIIRFFTVRRVSDARSSAFWALFFIAILYTTAPAVAVFAKYNLIKTMHMKDYASLPDKHWFKKYENIGLIMWIDRDGDGKIKIGKSVGTKFKGQFTGEKGNHGERILSNAAAMEKKLGANGGELIVNRDIMVLANPELDKRIPEWVTALVIAGGLAAALSTAAGLLLVISTSISHDLLRKIVFKNMSDTQELLAARIAAGVAVILAGLLGIAQLGFVAQVVAFAFGLAASSFFPAIILGIFNRKVNREGAISGMIVGIVFTAGYIIYFKFVDKSSANWLFGISPEGIGTVGMLLNFVVTLVVSKLTPEPPQEVQDMVESIRYPKEMG